MACIQHFLIVRKRIGNTKLCCLCLYIEAVNNSNDINIRNSSECLNMSLTNKADTNNRCFQMFHIKTLPF